MNHVPFFVEVAAYDDYVKFKDEQGRNQASMLRAEGKRYVVQDGDVMHSSSGSNRLPIRPSYCKVRRNA